MEEIGIEITLVTSNENKFKEIKNLINFPINSEKIDLPEIQSLHVAKVACEKAKFAYNKIGNPVIVDDSGLYISALNGLPGPFITWFIESLGIYRFLNSINFNNNRKAYVSTCISFADGKDIYPFVGTTHGSISQIPRGTGFGYDPIFIPDGSDKTFGEMTFEEKKEFSMRQKALKKFEKYFKENVVK